MKKIILVNILALMLMIPVVSATDISIEKKSEKTSILRQNFTHTVFVEYGSMTTCPPCVTASAQLYSIYNSEDLDFNYVTLLWDEGTYNVRGRLLELGVVAVPDVYFDGGYKRVEGPQTNVTPYGSAITNSGERDVPDIDINVDVRWLGGGKLKIGVTVINNDVEEFNGRIRTYIVEKESRWDDYGGNPYHYAALYIPIDKTLAVVKSRARPLGDTYTISKTWWGALYGFGDIKQENIIVITALFEKDTKYVVQTASAEPTATSSNYRSINLMILRLLERFLVLERLINLE